MNPSRAWFLLAISVAVILAYACGGVSHHDFVYLDDNFYLFQNQWTTQGLTWDSLHHHFTHTTGGQYLPVTMISYLPLVWLFGMKAPPQIWFNVVVHTLNCLLIVWVLHKYTGRFWAAGIVAMLFALHPIHVESVAWATERKDVLYMFFGLLTLGTYADYARKPGFYRYALVLLFYTLSMLSKAMLVTLPALLLLLDVWPLKRISTSLAQSIQDAQSRKLIFRLLGEKLPLLLIALLMSLITLKSTTGVPTLAQLPLGYRIGVAVTGYVDYLSALVWPSGLCALYPIPQTLNKSEIALKAGILIVITGACIWQWAKRPYLLIGWLWYVVTLAPVSGLLQAGNQARADRFTYWPFLGLYIALAWAVCDWATPVPDLNAQASNNRQSRKTTLLAAALFCIAAALFWVTVSQVAHWSDSPTLFKRILQVTGHNPQIRTALGTYYLERKNLADAQHELQIAVEEKPDHLQALVPLAQTYAQTGQPQAALRILDHIALLPSESNPATSDAALLYLQLGEPQKAMNLIARCLSTLPNDPAVQNNAGIIYVWAGATPEQKSRGLSLLESALEKSPQSPAVLTNLGAANFILGRYGEAQVLFLNAINTDPRYLRPYSLLGHLYEKTSSPALAVQIYKAGLAIDPTDAPCADALQRLLSKVDAQSPPPAQ